MDYWKGFTGGLLAGMALGIWVYFSPRFDRKVIDYDGLRKEGPERIPLHRESPESAGDPAQLVPDTLGSSKLDFERSRPKGQEN